jgi:hypothetical protein
MLTALRTIELHKSFSLILVAERLHQARWARALKTRE